MNEQIVGRQTKLRSYLDRVAVVVFLLFLAGTIYAFLQEQSASLKQIVPPPKKPLEVYLPNEEYDKAMQLFNVNPDLEKNEDFISLGRFNVFDYKTVRDHEIILKEMNQKFAQAQKLYNDGKYTEARKILKDILTVWPAHLNSQDLLKKIDEQLSSSSASTS
jgi:hypothetical protein